MRDADRFAFELILAFGERWRPHRTTAAWYLWRAADRAKRPAAPKR